MLDAYMLNPILVSKHPRDKYDHPHFRGAETEAPESLNNLPAASRRPGRKPAVSYPPHLHLCLSNSLLPRLPDPLLIDVHFWGSGVSFWPFQLPHWELWQRGRGREGIAVRKVVSSSCPSKSCGARLEKLEVFTPEGRLMKRACLLSSSIWSLSYEWL